MSRDGTADDPDATNVATRATRNVAPTGVFRVGDVIDGRYRLDAHLGKGAFGAVFRATQLPREGEWGRHAGRGVAIKVLHHDVLANALGRERFRREALLAQKLQHPNVVHLHDFGETADGIPFIVFELLVGRTLDAVVKEEGPLAEARVVRVAVQVLKALMEAHAVGIVHRDIKPANLFVADFPGEPDFVKVLDFGVAKSVGVTSLAELTRTGQLVGTPAYMAPEMLRGGAATPASDIYALGLMLIRILSGELAYKGTAAEVIHGQLSAEPVPLPARAAQSSIAPVIRRAVEKDPSRRYPTASAMLDDLVRAGSAPRSFPSVEATNVPRPQIAPMPPTPPTNVRIVQPTPVARSMPIPVLAAPPAFSPARPVAAAAQTPIVPQTPVQREPQPTLRRRSRTPLVVALVVAGAGTFALGIFGTRALLFDQGSTPPVAAASKPLLAQPGAPPIKDEPKFDPQPLDKDPDDVKTTIDAHIVRNRLESLGWTITNKPTTDVSGPIDVTRIEAKRGAHDVTVMVYEAGSASSAKEWFYELSDDGGGAATIASRRTVLQLTSNTLSDTAIDDLTKRLGQDP